MRALALLLVAACGVTDPADDDPAGPSGGKADDSSTHRLPGHDETILTGDWRGKLALLHVGETFSAQPVETTQNTSPVTVRSRDGLFYALYRNGALDVIDPETGKIARSVQLLANPGDIEWANDHELYVSAGNAIARFDLERGAQVGTIDLAAVRGTAAKMQLRHMRKVGDRLYVQVARMTQTGRADRSAVAVIDTTRDGIESVIELQSSDGVTGIGPDLAMALDEQRGHLYVSALGERPSNTGGLFRIDTARAQLHDAYKAESGFQGIAVVGAPWTKLYMIYHTSTPTTSSHLFDYAITDAGALEPIDGPAIVDAFDGIDALAINEAGTLVAMANTCITGFCIGGAGISFVDAHTGKRLPKLLKDKIGFEPSLVHFR